MTTRRIQVVGGGRETSLLGGTGPPPGASEERGLSLSRIERPRVLVLHRRLLVAQVLARRLAVEPQVSWATASDDLDHARRLVATVDLVVLDSGARRSDGASLLGELVGLADGPVVLLVGEVDEDPAPALIAGARGWVPLDATLDLLAAALHAVAQGDIWLPQAVYPAVVARLVQSRGGSSRLSTLTRRQLEVLQALVDGLSIQDSATALFMSQNTVRTHRTRLFGKLGVHSALEAVAIAREAGLSPR